MALELRCPCKAQDVYRQHEMYTKRTFFAREYISLVHSYTIIKGGTRRNGEQLHTSVITIQKGCNDVSENVI